MKGKTAAELKEDENQICVTALRITSNINVLIRDLFHVTPTYKSVVRLSWLSEKVRERVIELRLFHGTLDVVNFIFSVAHLIYLFVIFLILFFSLAGQQKGTSGE